MTIWTDPTVAGSIATAWDYMRLVHDPVPSNAILVLGSFDVEAAAVAARLWHDRVAPVVVMSGGLAHCGGLLDTGWDRPEAVVFADRAVAEGMPRGAILVEDRAQNTGENFALGRRVAEAAGLHLARLTVVAKPYMTRRGWATGRRVWPEVELRMRCEEIGLTAYFARDPNPGRTLRALVGDLHRILVYPALGFSEPQDVPQRVIEALRILIDAGYGDRLVPGHPF